MDDNRSPAPGPGFSSQDLLIGALRVALVGGLVLAVLGAVLGGRGTAAATQGGRLLATGQYNAAQAAYMAALSLRGLGRLDGPARLGLSTTYLARRDTLRAAQVLAPVLNTADTRLRARALVQQGRILAWDGQWAAAQALWMRAAALPLPTDADSARVRRAAQWHAAEAAWQAGNWAGAATGYAALTGAPAPPHDPYVTSAALRLAQVRSATGDGPALPELAAARAGGPPDSTLGDAPFLNLPGQDEGLPPAVWTAQLAALEGTVAQVRAAPPLAPASRALLWGQMWVQAGEWATARRTLDTAVTLDPTLADAWAMLGLAAQRLDDPVRALDALQTAVRLAPDRPLGHHLLARFYLADRALVRAQIELDWLRTHDSNSVITALDSATWYRLQGDWANAEAEYLQAVALQPGPPVVPDSPDAVLNPALLLAQFYQERAIWACAPGRPAAARALAAHAGAAEYDTLGWAAHLCYDDAAARAPLEEAVRLAPRDPRPAYHLGVVLKALGEPERARLALLRASDYDPGGAWERRALAALTQP